MLGTLQQRHKRQDVEQPPLSPRKTPTTPANKGANAIALLALVFFASAAPVATQLVRRPDGSYPFEVVDVVLRAEVLKSISGAGYRTTRIISKAGYSFWTGDPP